MCSGFFLALMVVLYHLPITAKNIGIPFYDNLPIFHKGGVAVSYFFSLSGFLIIRNLYLENEKNGNISLLKFFKRRMLRLWPVYYLVILLGLITYQILIPALGINYKVDYSLKEQLLYYVFFLPNIFNHFNKVGGILNITWSIGVEEQFYLLFPFIFLIARKKIVPILAILVILLLALFFIYEELYVYQNLYFYFIFGGLFAILAQQRKLSFFKNKIVQILIFSTFIFSFFTNIFIFEDNRLTHLSQLIISNCLIVSLAYYPLFYLDKLKLNYFGEISYGIYMYHMIVTTFYLYATKMLNLTAYFSDALIIIINNFFVFSFTIFFAHISYRYFETRFLREKIVQIKNPFA